MVPRLPAPTYFRVGGRHRAMDATRGCELRPQCWTRANCWKEKSPRATTVCSGVLRTSIKKVSRSKGCDCWRYFRIDVRYTWDGRRPGDCFWPAILVSHIVTRYNNLVRSEAPQYIGSRKSFPCVAVPPSVPSSVAPLERLPVRTGRTQIKDVAGYAVFRSKYC